MRLPVPWLRRGGGRRRLVDCFTSRRKEKRKMGPRIPHLRGQSPRGGEENRRPRSNFISSGRGKGRRERRLKVIRGVWYDRREGKGSHQLFSYKTGKRKKKASLYSLRSSTMTVKGRKVAAHPVSYVRLLQEKGGKGGRGKLKSARP